MKLELKHLAPYLPYGLKVQCDIWNEEICAVDGFSATLKDVRLTCIIARNKERSEATTWTPKLEHCKPILRPLSDLTKNIDNDERNVKYYSLLKTCYSEVDLRNFQEVPLIQKYDDVQILLEYHFDIFGLIEKGLAIDINTLNQ